MSYYYSYYNYKIGEGFRENSDYISNNFYIHLGYDISKKTILTGEVSYLKYLAHQAGGLSDNMFRINPLQSNRSRNWFGLDWLLFNLKIKHKLNDKSNLSLSFFGLDAERNSIGFRTNRVDQIDPYTERDLIKGNFNNHGIEIKFLNNYNFLNKKNVFVIGGRYYRSKSTSKQGPGSDLEDADFNFYLNKFPNYTNQSDYVYPNKNFAFFGENIIYISEKFSLTPGVRYENILTKSIGSFKQINLDAAGNVIYNNTNYENKESKKDLLSYLV